MNIIYHSDAFANASRYGLSRYAWELLDALCRENDSNRFTATSSRFNLPAEALDSLPPCADFTYINRNHKAMLLSWAFAHAPDIERRVAPADLVHSVELDYPVSTSRPWIVTVHDLGPLTHPEYFSKSRPWLRRMGLKRALRKAQLIIAVSQATADAVESFSSQPLGQRLRVIHEGVSGEFFDTPPPACLDGLAMPPSGEPYFLWTGSINPRKNLTNVIRAFERIAEDCEINLVLAGGLGWDTGSELDIISRSPCAHRIFRTGFVSDEQLRALYRGASAFVYASFMEGFGLPILEAMACGCPVITSNLSSMPEVAGDVGLLVDPHDVEDIAAAMHDMAENDAERNKLSDQGIERARAFSWDKTARSMLKAYDDVY